MEQEKIDFYKGLAIYILPEGVTNYFDVVDFNEQPAKDHGKLYKTELHIYLACLMRRTIVQRALMASSQTASVKRG